MTRVITNHLSGENLDNEEKTLRDDCLEDLWNHMNDTSSYVRSKVLQIWNDLKTRNAVPLNWMLRIVTRAVERLEDKTTTVRKNAITLLKSFLESNPFASKVKSADLTGLFFPLMETINTYKQYFRNKNDLFTFQLQLELIERKLEKEITKMKEIEDNLRKQERSKDDMLADYMHRCVPELDSILTDILSDDKQVQSLIENPKNDEKESTQRIQKIRYFLNEGKFTDAALYVIQLDALVDNYNTWKEMQVKGKVLYFVTLLETYLFDDFVSKILILLHMCIKNRSKILQILYAGSSTQRTRKCGWFSSRCPGILKSLDKCCTKD